VGAAPRRNRRRVGETVVRTEDPPAAVDQRIDAKRRRASNGSAHEHAVPRAARLDRELDRVDPTDRLEDEVGPPSVSSRSASAVAARSSPASSPSVAPTASAASSFAGTRSTATIRDAPAMPAPITHDSPTPPRPITATLAPRGTSAVLSTAPTPVVTQQPISAATAGSTPSGSAIAAATGTTVASAMVAIPQYDRTAASPGRASVSARTVAPSGIRWRNEGESTHAQTRPARHERHTPHGTSHDRATG
jgi:hypothetical protein